MAEVGPNFDYTTNEIFTNKDFKINLENIAAVPIPILDIIPTEIPDLSKLNLPKLDPTKVKTLSELLAFIFNAIAEFISSEAWLPYLFPIMLGAPFLVTMGPMIVMVGTVLSPPITVIAYVAKD